MSTGVFVRPSPALLPHVEPSLRRVPAPEPFTLVIFGATGDLTARKLLPALYGLWQGDFLPDSFAVIGVGRREKNDEEFRNDVRNAISAFRDDLPATADAWRSFLAHFFYHQADITVSEGIRSLAGRVQVLEPAARLPGNRIFYLALAPQFFAPVVAGLDAADLVRRNVERPWARVVIEKPFGRDLASARELDRYIQTFLRPEQVYRIDHYLGKETVQNVLAFRFGNSIFEPLFRRELVDFVQITVGEMLGMEGRRGAYYDEAGALRDVLQNHLLQLLALVTMDPPATLTAGDISDAKLKVLRMLVPPRGAEVARRVVRGQYGPGMVDGRAVRGYRQEEGVAADSNTETFVALRTEIASWRWAGVPFLLRTGKRLARHATEIAVQFKLPPLQLFQTVECEGDLCIVSEQQPAILQFRIQPDEGISLSFSAKRPGMLMDLEPVCFNFQYGDLGRALPGAYERLLLDAMRGDATLFPRSDELEASWKFVTPILEAWAAGPPPKFPNYAAGTWGPPEAENLAEGRFGGWKCR
jgi:glucose-6-phosphate 1-dehydrogenase